MSDWPTIPVRRLFSIVNGGTPTAETPNWGGDVAWATPVDLAVVDGGLLGATQRTLTEEGLRTGSGAVPGGSLVLSTRAPIGYVAEAKDRTAFNQGCRGLVPSQPVDTRYFRYQLSVATDRLVARGQGSTFVELSGDALAAFPLVAPPVLEQRAIADYLDRETARIDALIAAKQRMVELLEERGQVEISEMTSSSVNHEATTPTASVWYPRIPAHWRLATIGQVTRLVADGPHVSPDYTDERGIPFLSVRNVVAADWDFPSAKYISERNFEMMSRRVCPELGDVLLTKGGTTGVARVVDIPTRFQVWVHVAVLKLRRELIEPDYLAAALNSFCGAAQSKLGTRGATNQDLALGRIAKIEIALPSLPEQAAICVRIRDRQAYHHKAEDMLERQISLLREHRQALIASAVTGQVDIPVAA